MSASVPPSIAYPDVDVAGEHQVTLNVSILQAVESTDRDGGYRESVRDGGRKRIYESPTPTHHFHTEYKLLPGRNAQVFKTDVVTFSNIVAKVYTDRDNRVVQCWSDEEGEGRLNHYGWRHKHTFKVNKAQLLEIYDHVLEIRVWNTKSKLSARAKYDRPKAFRIPIRNNTLKGDLNTESDNKEVPGVVKRPSKFAVVYHDQVRRMKANRQSNRLLSTLNAQTVVPAASVQNTMQTEESGVSLVQIPSHRSFNQIQEEEGVALESSKGTLDVNKVASSSSANQLVPASSSVAQSTSLESATTQESNKQLQVISRRKQKRLEAEAAEEARIEREGIAVLRVKLLDLFGKHGYTKLKLDSPVKDLKQFEVGVSVTDTLLTEQLSKELNPMMITVVKATGLPSAPVPYDQLQQRCDPAFVRYQFHTQSPHCTHGVTQGPEAVWNDTHVVLLGVIDQQLLVEYLRGPPLVLELHDRSQRSEDRTVPALFGAETRDDVLGTHAFTAGLSHTSTTEGCDKPWSPYGVARLDLSGLLLGQRVIELTVPVTSGPRFSSELQQTAPADPLPPGDYISSECQLKVLVEVSHPLCLSPALDVRSTPAKTAQSHNSKVERHSNTATLDRRASKATPEHASPARRGTKVTPEHTVIEKRGSKITPEHTVIEKRGSKITPEHTVIEKRGSKATPEHTATERRGSKATAEHAPSERRGSKSLAKPPLDTCPFNRAIYILSSKGRSLVEDLVAKVNQINTEALSLQSLPEDVLPAALSTYKLTKDEMSSSNCDIITGFHVEDQEQHIIVLEGLKKGGLKRIWDELPHHSTEDDAIQKVLYNSEFEFSQRLYAGLDVDLSMIRLFQPLSELTRQSLVYIRDALPDKCFRALMTLNELSYANEMSDVTRNNLFPRPEEVTALSLQFAVPSSVSLRDNGEGSDVITDGQCIPSTLTQSKSSRVWKPLDLANPHFQKHLEERKSRPAVDFINANKLHVLTLSETSASKKLNRPSRQRSLSETTPVHNYSTQTFNSVRLAKARLRERLASDPEHRYTYCQQYHSRTVVPIDIEAEHRAQRQDEKGRWHTAEGFVYPGMPSAKSSNVHPKRPHPSRVESLQEPFEDNLLHANTLEPTVERTQFSWESRHEDFERWERPPSTFGPPLPVTIHLAGESRARELQETLDLERKEWTNKLVVSNPRFEPHRCGIRTELTESGPKAGTQLDRLQGMLKDSPKKYSLKQGGLTVHDMPALNVVHNPRLANPNAPDTEDDVCKRGYVPGPDTGRSLKLDSNVIPLTNTAHGGFVYRGTPKHPQDFRLYYHIPTIPAGAVSGVTQGGD